MSNLEISRVAGVCDQQVNGFLQLTIGFVRYAPLFDPLISELNRLSNEGWELIGELSNCHYIFKRKKP